MSARIPTQQKSPFEIDPRPYEALLDQAKAKLQQDEAQLKFDEGEYQRNLKLLNLNSLSRSEFEKSQAARDVDIANIAADKALIAQRALDLQYTKIPRRSAGASAVTTSRSAI